VLKRDLASLGPKVDLLVSDARSFGREVAAEPPRTVRNLKRSRALLGNVAAAAGGEGGDNMLSLVTVAEKADIKVWPFLKLQGHLERYQPNSSHQPYYSPNLPLIPCSPLTHYGLRRAERDAGFFSDTPEVVSSPALTHDSLPSPNPNYTNDPHNSYDDRPNHNISPY
jgi:hypothetical protein